MKESNKSLREMPIQEVYLLGKKGGSPVLQRYVELMERCKDEGEFLSFETTPDWLSCYSGDAQPIHTKLPLLVFRPYATTHIAPFLQVCYQREISVTARCGGSGLTGGCVPSQEGVVLLTGHLNQMINYDSQKGTISLEPGVTVRQLNRYVAPDGWHFPLSLASGGIAGIAGCLSCHARGYHQQQRAIYEAIEQVTLIDGRGEIMGVPPSLVCGAEGLWGVICELKMNLKKHSESTQCFCFMGSWEDVLVKLPALRSLHTLTEAIWSKEKFYFKLEGEKWRSQGATAYLAKCFPGIEQVATPIETVSQSFIPSRQHFAMISSLFQMELLTEALAWSLRQAQAIQLECFQMVDLLAGGVHLILQSEENLYSFSQKLEYFLVLWADYVDDCHGVIASTHGVGMQMRHYMPPFWTEESQRLWRNLQIKFDPKNLFGKERFFPTIGKSLEKVKPF